LCAIGSVEPYNERPPEYDLSLCFLYLSRDMLNLLRAI
jgi:hypothetical protein